MGKNLTYLPLLSQGLTAGISNVAFDCKRKLRKNISLNTDRKADVHTESSKFNTVI